MARSRRYSRQTFRRARHVRQARAFDRAFRHRARAADGLLAVHAVCNHLGHNRLGLAVGKRVGGAVVRNRVKRRIREAFRTQAHALPQGFDLIVVPSAACAAEGAPVGLSFLANSRRAIERAHRGDPPGPGRRERS